MTYRRAEETRTKYCEVCKKETEQCVDKSHRGENRCIPCNGGYGILSTSSDPLCESCGYDDGN